MISERWPNATIITCWHIRWSNPEAFAICPWHDELLADLLGSSSIGFHTRFHRNHFIAAVFALDDPLIITLRVGRKRSSRAHYYLRGQTEIDALLRYLVECIGR